jgi:hypothetical protein
MARYFLTVVPARGVNGARALMWLCESIKSRYGLVITNIKEDEQENQKITYADIFRQFRHDNKRGRK